MNPAKKLLSCGPTANEFCLLYRMFSLELSYLDENELEKRAFSANMNIKKYPLVIVSRVPCFKRCIDLIHLCERVLPCTFL